MGRIDRTAFPQESKGVQPLPNRAETEKMAYDALNRLLPTSGAGITDTVRIALGAVSSAEFGGIEATGAFLTTAGAFEGKQFARWFGETMALANSYSDVGAIMSVSVPKILMPAFERRMADPFNFRSGMITVPESRLWIWNTFNYGIKHKFWLSGYPSFFFSNFNNILREK